MMIWRNSIARLQWCFGIALFVLAVMAGCRKEEGAAATTEECLSIHEVSTSEVTPAGVRTVFQVLDCEGYPVTGLRDYQLSIRLDGESITYEGGRAPVLTQQVGFEQYGLVLLDMSDSIVRSGSLQPMLSSARVLIQQLLLQGVQVAVYQFAGPTYFAEVQTFTADGGLLDTALDTLAASTGLGTTDLYGSIPRAIEALESRGSLGVLSTHTLVVFTDGTDEAMVETFESAKRAVDTTSSEVFTVGLGRDVNQEELIVLGKTGFQWAKDTSELEAAFGEVSRRIGDLSKSYYLVGVCSPRASGKREMTIVINRDSQRGELTVSYDATGFDIVGCDANVVAFPCQDQVCGSVDGFLCGTCPGKTFCNESLVCEEACVAGIECGVSQGVDCGDCSEKGAGFMCSTNTCVNPCAGVQCGIVLGTDCGDCSSLGATFGCDQNHTCVDACAGAECGIAMGVDCGDCAVFGAAFGCDASHTCVDACADAECGIANGVDCGDCAPLGATFGCDTSHTCVDACAQAECGVVNGVGCGDCSALGALFACDENNQCVNACAGAECGVMLGVDCGDCAVLGDTFGCDANHTCVDACAGAECGVRNGVDCGDCTAMGASFGCDSNNTCVDACGEAECGIVLGVDCGDCAKRGEGFACDTNHVCTDACGEAECGIVLGVSCGDCAKRGTGFGCDASLTCVEACAGVECGTLLGVDCGSCEVGFECTGEGLCTPEGLPGMTWASVGGGVFTIGCDMVSDPDCDVDESAYGVELSAYWMMSTEVTLSMYQACTNSGSCGAGHLGSGAECNGLDSAAASPDLPINCIDWEGMAQFCAFIDARLPTEAEWERAIRGDHDGTIDGYWIYPWGNSPAPDCGRVVMNEGGPGCGTGLTSAVGTKAATAFGLLDMAGNVAEWTADLYGERYVSCGDTPCLNPTGPTAGDERVVRGGAFSDMFDSAFRTAKRDKTEPATQSPAIGGRCVK